ncbi:hypothetical protein [Devosia sp.]|uniref:hypothetical protein n=1 Tax=Devosia sp. TaxID=1871048 RepID=UPI002FCAEC26
MHILKTTFTIGLLCAAVAMPTLAQDAAAPVEAPIEVPVEAPAEAGAEATTEPVAEATDPSGTFVDEFGTSFTFSLCGEAGTDLCGVLNTLEGESATEENLAFVGKLVMQAVQTAPNQWKGSLAAGGMSAEATVTQTSPDTIDIEGCRAAILCQTLTYSRG